MALRRCFLLLATTLALRAATYYVDSLSGDDGRSGTAEDQAWKTLNKVNGTELRAGDRVLLRSGSIWRGQLAPVGSGSEAAPVVIDRYGSGPKPHIDGSGTVDDAVRLYNIQFTEVRNLEVTNHGDQPATRR